VWVVPGRGRRRVEVAAISCWVPASGFGVECGHRKAVGTAGLNQGDVDVADGEGVVEEGCAGGAGASQSCWWLLAALQGL